MNIHPANARPGHKRRQPLAASANPPAPRFGLGLRLGVVWLLLVIVWAGVIATVHHPALPFDMPFMVKRAAVAMLAGGLGTGVVVFAVYRLDRRSLASLGLGSLKHDWRALLIGAGLWLALAAIAVVVGKTVGAFDVEFSQPTWAFLGWLTFHIALVFCYEALPEELAMRGYMYTNLAERLPRWLAVVGQAALFTCWAFAFVLVLEWIGVGSDWSIGLDRTILFVTFGLTLALVRLWTGSLWAAIGFHLAFQTVMQMLYTGRFVVMSIPRGTDVETAGIYFWFFTIILGGVIALVVLVRKGHQVAELREDNFGNRAS